MPALFRPGPRIRGICLIKDSEARKASYFLAVRRAKVGEEGPSAQLGLYISSQHTHIPRILPFSNPVINSSWHSSQPCQDPASHPDGDPAPLLYVIVPMKNIYCATSLPLNSELHQEPPLMFCARLEGGVTFTCQV